MTIKKLKYNGSGTHRRAILHMIGQAVELFKSKPSVAEIAAWMNVSKTTALRHLKAMEARGEIIMSKEEYRSNNFKWRVELHSFVLEQYYLNMLINDYKIYTKRVLSIYND